MRKTDEYAETSSPFQGVRQIFYGFEVGTKTAIRINVHHPKKDIIHGYWQALIKF